jgi:membrane protein
MSKPGRLAQLKERASAWWRGAQGRQAWLAHVVRAWGRFTANNGNQYAGAITFFSFLALFPLILLAVSITGFVLHANPELQRELLDKVAENLPGGFGDTLQTAIDSAIANRAAVGVVGLVGLLLAGLGWIANLRMAINSVWGGTRQKRPLLKAKISDLIVLAGLGLGALISLAFTASATSVTDQLLRWIGLDHVPGAGVVTKILGLAIAVLGDMVIFGWLIIRLPRASVPRGVAFRAALLAAVGFEVLKIIGSYTIAATSHSPTAGPFAAIVAILVWMQLVARWLLFCAAWTATWITPAGEVELGAISVLVPPPAAEESDGSSRVSPAAVAASLVGAGAAVGGGTVAWLAARRARARRNGERSGRRQTRR